jgi:hypothetical protein
MDRFRCSSGLLAALVIGLVPWAANAQDDLAQDDRAHAKETPILASYDFEGVTPSGPDTFWLRDGRGGRVDLSSAFRISGERSLHLREVEGNRDFAEFLGYFDPRTSGTVFVQFYVLLTDPSQRFNFGLAGTGWFLHPAQHGHAVWIGTEGGDFGHRPDQRWQGLFEPQPFVWYFVDLVYRVDEGRYDLSIYEEGCGAACKEPVVDVRNQRNFADADDSSVRYFSFIGDLEDEGRFDYFVDDVLVATDPAVRQRPFVAPGRRTFFVDRWRMIESRLDDAAANDLIFAARRWLGSVEAVEAPAADQLEAAADAAFDRGDLDLADALYLRLAEDANRALRVRLKRADVAFRRGDTSTERTIREAIYGRLELEEHR